jgi:hypothetical protein
MNGRCRATTPQLVVAAWNTRTGRSPSFSSTRRDAVCTTLVIAVPTAMTGFYGMNVPYPASL